MIENEIQRKILSQCSFYEKGGKYSDLRIKEIDNDLYNYHLQKLVKDGYLTKIKNLYSITQKGKSLVTNVDEKDLEIPPTFKVSVYLCPIKGEKILLTKRLKHPQYGYTGLIAEKKKFGEKILDTAKRALLEETGLTANKFHLIGNLHQIRKDEKGKVIEDGIFYIFYVTELNGELIANSIEGEYFWTELSNVSSLKKIFKPSLEIIVEEVIARLTKKEDWNNKFIYEFLPKPELY